MLVLVVDDEPAVCRLTARMLASSGFDVLEAHDAGEALGLLQTADVAAVVSDISMPGMSGVELRARIGERWPGVPVLLVSGRGRPPDGDSGLFLDKPFTPKALVDALAELVALPKH